jgi:hypothetical protein
LLLFSTHPDSPTIRRPLLQMIKKKLSFTKQNMSFRSEGYNEN